MKKTISGKVVTSGYCPECFRKKLAEIEAFCGYGRKEKRQRRAAV